MRDRLRTIDRWLYLVAEVLVEDRCVVPEPLFHEISGFLHQEMPALYREL